MSAHSIFWTIFAVALACVVIAMARAVHKISPSALRRRGFGAQKKLHTF
jgi:hypothetical protein